MLVPPVGPRDAKIAIVGESPGEEEVRQRMPFVGPAGRVLETALRQAGLRREDCYITNLMQMRPEGNNFAHFYLDKAKRQPSVGLLQGIERVKHELSVVAPHITILCGAEPMRAFLGHRDITGRRGYVVDTEWGKMLPTYHPAAVLHAGTDIEGRSYFPLLCFDMAKARRESLSPSRVLPKRELLLRPTFPEALHHIARMEATKDPVVFDIETDPKGSEWYCIAFSDAANWAMCLPTSTQWGADLTYVHEVREAVKRLLENPKVPKIAQNAQFDVLFLREYYKIATTPIVFDTMTAHHTVYPELPKSLELLASLYTEQPYYKDMEKIPPSLWEYNCLAADTRIALPGRKYERIQQLVKRRYNGPVLTMDQYGHLRETLVVGWHRKVKRGTTWLKVRTGNSRYGGTKGTICTPDHRWWTQRGWIEAYLLQPGLDRIPTPFLGSDDLIHGTLLGDGCATTKGRLMFSHANHQYAADKAAHLGTVPRLRQRGPGAYKSGIDAAVEVGISREWRERFYPQGKKVFIPPPSWRAIAIWYGDDGCLANDTQPRLATCSFVGDTARSWLAEWLRKCGGKGIVSRLRDGSLAIGGTDRMLFLRCLAPFLPPPVRYKLPIGGGLPPYNGWLAEQRPQWATVEAVTPYNPKARKKRGHIATQYCLDVAGTDNRFMTSSGLVHNCLDAAVTYECYLALSQELTELGVTDFYREYVLPLIDPLLDMQEKGVCVDLTQREIVARQLQEDLNDTEAELTHLAYHWEAIQQTPDGLGSEHYVGLNAHSPKQLQAYLFTTLRLPRAYKRKTGALTTDEDSLAKLQKKYGHPSIGLILFLRQMQKLLSTYVLAPLGPDARLRCSYVVGGTETGRLASRESIFGTGTNLQNVPHGIARRLLVPSPGTVFVQADLSQAEARIVAYLAGDETLIDLFTKGGDIHRENAAHLFHHGDISRVTKQEREVAKRLVHAANYGIGPVMFQEVLRQPPPKGAGLDVSKVEAQRLLNLYHGRFPKIRFWHTEVEGQLQKSRILTSPVGRKRRFFGRWGDELLREGYAHVPQSTVADILNRGLVEVHQRIASVDHTARLVLTVHDSVVVECRQTHVAPISRLLRQCLERPIRIHHRVCTIPCDLKVGANWEDLDPYTTPEQDPNP